VERRDGQSEPESAVALIVDENASLGAAAIDPVLDTAVESRNVGRNVFRKDDDRRRELAPQQAEQPLVVRRRPPDHVSEDREVFRRNTATRGIEHGPSLRT